MRGCLEHEHLKAVRQDDLFRAYLDRNTHRILLQAGNWVDYDFDDLKD